WRASSWPDLCHPIGADDFACNLRRCKPRRLSLRGNVRIWRNPAKDLLPEIEERGASVVAVSPQTAPNSRKSARQNHLTFPILSDSLGKVSGEFGLRFKLPDYLIELYKSLKNELPSFNGDASWILPMPVR